jgi:hypothetical protein
MELLNGMLKDHMNTNNVLVPEECGLRTGMSTNDAVIELTHRILKNVNKKSIIMVKLALCIP